MVFSNIFFVFFFLPIVLGLYYISNQKIKNYILLTASLLFYAYGEPRFVFIMLLSIVANYLFALVVDASQNRRQRISFLIIAVCTNLGILFVFKYLAFSIEIINSLFNGSIEPRKIALPIGISFYTFQAMSYVIDVYRKKVKVQKNPFIVALYVSFFPQLIAGPIVRYSDIEEQIENRTESLEKFGYGAKRFICGFSKKVIIATGSARKRPNIKGVAEFEGKGISYYGNHPIIYFWIGSLCYSLQIFYDFSGYSDMAIGLGSMFGFKYLENFNYPYISKSITEFWRRWHISLSSWFRDYVYIPLGGSRKGKTRQIINLFIVWMLTGLWHGANYTFVLWGLLYFALLVFEKFIIKPNRLNKQFSIIWGIVTLMIVNIEWVIFNSPNIRSSLRFIAAMFGHTQ